jgi:DmsE family decaheme c-type cytochrome
MKIQEVIIIALLVLTGNQLSRAAQVKVDEPDICLMCHADIEEEMTTKSVLHAAFESGACSDCHNPHASKHAALLNQEIKDLCLTCHTDLADNMELLSTHQPVADGKCLDCHDPHGSDVKNILQAPAMELCSGCHENVSGWLSKAYVHKPIAQKQCEACHDPHGSTHERLLDQSIPALCYNCHTADASLAAVHEGFDLSQANCVSCHDPHASERDKLMMPNQHSPFKSGKCELCHATQSGSSAFALIDDVKPVCGKCHQSPLREAEKKYAHIMNDDESCLNCHNAHASSTTSLLSAEEKSVCLRCHFKGEEFEDKPIEGYLTHDGFGCSSCHTPHGSDNERYLASLDLDLCTGCHVDVHRASHPIGPQVIDKRTNAPLTCLSCHKMHGSDFENYLPLDPAMDLCIQCHRK